MAFTIEDASPTLAALCLPKSDLLAPLYIPAEGLAGFFRYRLRAMVHSLIRAATHDFTYLEYLPPFPPSEHRRLCAWVEILMWHFVSPPSVPRYYFLNSRPSVPQRVVARTIETRDASVKNGDLAWANLDFHVPGEAFQMLKLAAFLCHFVGFTTATPFPESLRPSLLVPLVDRAVDRIFTTRCRADYPEYDTDGRLVYPELIIPSPSPFAPSQPSFDLKNTDLRFLTLPMGITGP